VVKVTAKVNGYEVVHDVI